MNRPEWTKGVPRENEFLVFSNSEMNVTEKVKWDHLVFIFPSYVMVLKLPKEVILIFNFVLTLARNLLKQFT